MIPPSPTPDRIVIANWVVNAELASYRASDAWSTFQVADDVTRTFRLADINNPSDDSSALDIYTRIIDGSGTIRFNYNDYLIFDGLNSNYIKKLNYVDYTGLTDIIFCFRLIGDAVYGQTCECWLFGNSVDGGIVASYDNNHSGIGTSVQVFLKDITGNQTLPLSSSGSFNSGDAHILWWNEPTKTARLYIDGVISTTTTGTVNSNTTFNWKEMNFQLSDPAATAEVRIASITLLKSSNINDAYLEITKTGATPTTTGIAQRFGVTIV